MHLYLLYDYIIQPYILPFVTTQMDFEGITLSELSQTDEDKHCMIFHVHRIQKVKFIKIESRLMVARGLEFCRVGTCQRT